MFNPIYSPILRICKSSTLLSTSHYSSTLHYCLISCCNISSSLKFPSTTLLFTPVSLLYSIKIIESKLIQSNQFKSNQIKSNQIKSNQSNNILTFFLSFSFPFLFSSLVNSFSLFIPFISFISTLVSMWILELLSLGVDEHIPNHWKESSCLPRKKINPP